MDKIYSDLIKASFKLGQYTAAVERFPVKYSWPLKQDDPAAVAFVERWVRRCHWQIPYRLFGWDYIVYLIDEELRKSNDRRDANLQRGAYI